MSKFTEIADAFQSVDAEDRLDVLLDYADRLPDLPHELAAVRDSGLHQVHECQSPVFLYVTVDGEVRIFGDVPREAPTARSFVAILIDAFDGTAPADVLAAPADPLRALGLDQLIGMQRTRGLSAVYGKLRSTVAAGGME